MNFITSLLFGFFGIVLASFFISCYVEPLAGDLTRIGKLAERDFGGNLNTKPYFVRGLDPLNESNIIVLGDSFSMGNLWQSHLYDLRGYKSYSLNIAPNDCLTPRIEKLIGDIGRNYPNIHTLIIQSVERDFIKRLAKPSNLGCNRDFEESPAKARKIMGGRSHNIANLNTDLVYLISAFINHFKIDFSNPWQHNTAVILPLKTASLFSNYRSSSLLFFLDDSGKSTLTNGDYSEAIENIRKLQSTAKTARIKVYFLAIPDKSTVYRGQLSKIPTHIHLEAPRNLTKWLKTNKVPHIDVFERFSQESKKTIDFYAPNDTHLSEAGYRVLAEEINIQLQKNENENDRR